MSILFSKELLMAESKVTLTVSTDPASATCTLTYNGQSYSAKSATVKKGTVISYSVYHSTYGTKTGSIIMDSDYTLTFTGTYTTSTVDVDWTQPVLSSNGTLGGSDFAVDATTVDATYYGAWRAFDGITSSTDYFWRSRSLDLGATHPYTIYNPTPLKITNIAYLNYGQTIVIPISYTVQVSNDNSNWTQIASGTNSVYTAGQTWNISLSGNSNYYKYYKLMLQNGSSSGYVICMEMGITAKYQQTSYTYYWEVTTS